jgi:hypothetical protein
VPSHNTLNALDPVLFEECFVTWSTGLRVGCGEEAVVARETVAVDGKVLV